MILVLHQKKMRVYPNILITGTPGTGKTTTAELVSSLCMQRTNEQGEQESQLIQHINIGELVKRKEFYDGYDDQLDTHVLNEDKVRKRKGL
jgi:adenylate kinase